MRLIRQGAIFFSIAGSHRKKIPVFSYRNPRMLLTNSVQKPEELVQIVDEHNQPVRSARREEMRAKNLIHRCSFTMVFNSAVS
jgi:hypothetical protein